MKNTAVDVRP